MDVSNYDEFLEDVKNTDVGSFVIALEVLSTIFVTVEEPNKSLPICSTLSKGCMSV